MHRNHGLTAALLLLCLALLVAGCAGTSARTEELLAKDYRTMGDQELLTYYYQLNDQIARAERATRGTTFGVGIGTGNVGVGATQGIGRPVIAGELRERRNEVRAELTVRGLRP